jgi:hypothetical protein
MRLYIYVEEAGEWSGMGLCLIGGHLLNIRPQKSKMSNYIFQAKYQNWKKIFTKLCTESSCSHMKSLHKF